MRTYRRLIFVAVVLLLGVPADLTFTTQADGDDAPPPVLYTDDAQFQKLSSGAQILLERKYGPKEPLREQSSAAEGAAPGGSLGALLPNTLVNDPTADPDDMDTQSETTIVLGSDGRVVVGFNDSGSFGEGLHFTGFSVSDDGGETWDDQGPLPDSAEGDAGDPVLARGLPTAALPDTIYFTTLGFDTGETLQTFRSFDNGDTFEAPVGSTPGFDGTGDFQDKPWMATDNFPGDGDGEGNVYIAWRNFSGFPGSGGPYGIRLVRSTDGGDTWEPDGGTLIVDEGANNVQGAYVVVGPDHTVYVFWLDQSAGFGTPNVMMMRKSTDQGDTFDPPVTITTLNTTSINGNEGLNGGFRSNSFPQVGIDPNTGYLYLVYNDTTGGVDDSDVFLTHSIDGGDTWSDPVRVNDDETTNDQWQPALAVAPDGSGLFVGFYDRRFDPANSLIDVFGVIGEIDDTNVTFGANFRITDESFPVVVGQDPVVNFTYMGDYDVAVADDEFFYYTWADNRLPNDFHDNQPDVRFTKFPLAGPVSLEVESVEITGGNDNGIVDGNECNSLTIILTNTSSSIDVPGDIPAELISITEGVAVTQEAATYPTVPAEGTATNDVLFTITTSPAFPCGSPIDLQLKVKTSEGTVFLPIELDTGSVPGTPERFDNDTPADIPDLGTVLSTIEVSGISGAIGKVTVSVHITHPFDADLELFLVGPDGTEVELSSDNGGSGNDYGTNCAPDEARTTFDDEADSSITSGDAPFLGSFIPEELLEAFNGLTDLDVNGTWSLRIVDDASSDEGTLQCWSLEITTTACDDGGGPCEPIPQVCLDPNSVLFDRFTLGSSSEPETVTVENCGTDDLVVSNVVISGANPDDFAILSDDCTGETIPDGEICEIEVVFSPLASGLRTATLEITDNASGSPHTVNLIGTGVVCPTAIVLAPHTLPDAGLGEPYDEMITASPGNPPFFFIRTAGTTPPGIALSSDGAITGTPTALGQYDFAVVGIDDDGCTGERYYSLEVRCPAITTSPVQLPLGEVGVAYDQLITGLGGVPPYTFEQTAGSLPEGMTLSSDGTLSGTPTSGSSVFTVTVTDDNDCQGTRTYTLLLADPPPSLSPPEMGPASLGEPYQETVTASGGQAPYTYEVTDGSVPEGLTLSGTGLVSGVPAEVGLYSFTVTATDAQGNAGSRSYKIEVNQPPILVTDDDGDVVILQLIGEGEVEVTLVGVDEGPIDQVSLTGTDGQSSLLILVTQEGGGDGYIDIGSIVSTGPMNTVFAPTANLVGAGIDFGELLRRLWVYDIVNGADVRIGGTDEQSTRVFAHVIGDDTTMELGSALKLLLAATVGQAQIITPSLGSAYIRGDHDAGILGDLAAEITISGAGVGSGRPALRRLYVAHTISNATVSVNGMIHLVYAYQIVDSFISAGYTPDDVNDPMAGGTFVPGLGMKRVSTRHRTAGLVRSVLGAAQVGRIALSSVATDASGEAFGVVANESIDAVTVRMPRFRWSPSGPADQGVGDFHVILY